MRVTQSMLSNNMLTNLSNSYGKLGKLQEQITSQKKFSKPSDDPSAAMMGMTYRKNLNQVEQHNSNIGEATSWTESTDSALSQAISALQRIRELAVQASNGTYEANQRESIAEEIKELKQHIIDIGDTQLGGQYIFNGFKTDVKPSAALVQNTDATQPGYSTDPNANLGAPSYGTGAIAVEIFDGIKITVNTSGEVFGHALRDSGSINKLFKTLTDPTVDETTITDRIADIDATIDEFLTVQAQVGAKQNRIDLMADRLSEQEVVAQKVLSNNEDVDMEKVIIEFTAQESVHNAALSVGAKIIQPSLLDFLR